MKTLIYLMDIALKDGLSHKYLIIRSKWIFKNDSNLRCKMPIFTTIAHPKNLQSNLNVFLYIDVVVWRRDGTIALLDQMVGTTTKATARAVAGATAANPAAHAAILAAAAVAQVPPALPTLSPSPLRHPLLTPHLIIADEGYRLLKASNDSKISKERGTDRKLLSWF